MKTLVLTSAVVLALSCAPSAVTPADSSGEQREAPVTTYQLTIRSVGMGQITRTAPGPLYEAGTQVALRATPADGWRFGEWSGDAKDTDPSVQVTMDADRAITATFIQQWRLTINVVRQGQVIADPPGPLYDAGSQVGLWAVPSRGWTFDHWEGAVTGTTIETSFTINAASVVTAVFDDPARLEVNDRLRAACVWFADAEIDATLIEFEQGRLDGATKSEMIDAVWTMCGEYGDPVVAADCTTCAVVLIDQVYRE